MRKREEGKERGKINRDSGRGRKERRNRARYMKMRIDGDRREGKKGREEGKKGKINRDSESEGKREGIEERI